MAMQKNGESSFRELPSAEFYKTAQAENFGLAGDAFHELLLAVADKCLPANWTDSQVIEFWRKLHLKDLALAHSCALGSRFAWDEFFARYGSLLYSAACKIVKDTRKARELSDTVTADLFSSSVSVGRISKLASYSGRGSLESWLRVNLVQANVDWHRSERRLISFDEIAGSLGSFSAAEIPLHVRRDKRIEDSLKEAISELAAEDRFLLASYYLDRRNLAQIAALLRVHQSTISRRLNRASKAIRKGVLRKLRDCGVSQENITDSLRLSLEEPSFDIRAYLLIGLDSIKGRP